MKFFREGPNGEKEPQVSDEVVEYLVLHPPKGNARELLEFLVRAMNASRGDVIMMPPLHARELAALSAAMPVSVAAKDETPVSTTAPTSTPAFGPAPAPARSVRETADPSSEVPVTDEGQRRSASGPYGREALVAILEADEWNVSRVGRRLGVHRNTLLRWMRAHGIERRDTGT